MMNGTRLDKRATDVDPPDDFELIPQRVDRLKMITSLEHLARPNTKDGTCLTEVQGKHSGNPYSIVFESGCKLHPAGNYSSQFHFKDPFYKYDPCYNVDDVHYSGFCNNEFYCKHNGDGAPPPPSPRVYFQKPPLPHPATVVPSSPVTATVPQNVQLPPSPTAGLQLVPSPHVMRSTTQGTMNSDINRNSSTVLPNVVEMDIFLKNRVVVKLEVSNGQMATCRDFIALIMEEPEVGVPKDAEELFALWLISPLFEVQLKPEHKPHQIWKKWPELLSKYTTASAAQRDKDQPYLSFQRDVFYPLRDEVRLATLTVLELLYEEAKSNVLVGRYPCDQMAAEKMAGMQARIEFGKFDAEIHTPAFIKSQLEFLLPSYACKPKWSIFNIGSKSGLEYRIWLQFRNASDDLSVHSVMRQYLELCWNLPFYGSAFFIGQLEKPVTGLAALIGYHDFPVTVAINADGVTILSSTEGVLLGLKYRELSWDSARPAQDNNPNCLSCLFLQFQTQEGGQRVFKVLQVFSKQAILMDAIISSFVRALRQRSWERDEVDDSAAPTPGDCTPEGDDVQTPLTTNTIYNSNYTDSDACLNSRLNRLSLATFNEDGDCIRLMGSWAFR